MSRIVNLDEAKTHLSRLIEEAAAGEEIIIAKAGRPRARIVPLAAGRKPRKPGGWEGQVWVSDDFHARLSPDELSKWYADGEADGV